MRAELCGVAGTGVVGGVESVASAGGGLVLAFGRHGDPPTLVGVSTTDDWRSLRTTWTRQLRVNPDDPARSRQQPTWLTAARFGDSAAVHVVTETLRLLVDGASGSVLAETEAPAPPNGPAVAVGNELVVAEGSTVHAYDATTLRSVWRRDTPGRRRAGPLSTDLLCGLHSFAGGADDWGDQSVWDLATDEVHPVARGAKAPVDAGPLFVIPCGRGSSADRVMGVTKSAFIPMWDHSYKAPAAGPFWAPPHVAFPVVLHADTFIVATDTPAVECREVASGRLIWTVELGGQPSAIRLLHDHVWVTTQEARLTAIDPTPGLVRFEMEEVFSELVCSIENAGSPASHGGVLVVGDRGSVLCVHLQ